MLSTYLAIQEKNGFTGRKKILKSDFLKTKRKLRMNSHLWARRCRGLSGDSQTAMAKDTSGRHPTLLLLGACHSSIQPSADISYLSVESK